MRFVLSGGGTAGHVYPALALAEELVGRGHEVVYAGCPDSMEERLAKEAGLEFVGFEARGFNRRHPAKLPAALLTNERSTRAARKLFRERRPDAVVAFGGYVCLPVGRAALAEKVPLIVHEQNSHMGLANAYLAKRADYVALTYSEAAEGRELDPVHTSVTGNPVRRSVTAATRDESRAARGYADDERVLLVFGGSLGARHINDAMVALKDELLKREGVRVIHVAGKNDYERVADALALTPDQAKCWELHPYLDAMGQAMAAADLVVSRAGATSLAEISARKVPAILVPYPYATADHQTKNARSWVERGCAELFADDELDGEGFGQAVLACLDDPERRRAMAEAAAGMDTADAAARLADLCVVTASRCR